MSASFHQPYTAHLVLVNRVTLLLVLQRGAELSLALVNPRDQMVAGDKGKLGRMSSQVGQYCRVYEHNGAHLRATLRDRGP